MRVALAGASLILLAACGGSEQAEGPVVTEVAETAPAAESAGVRIPATIAEMKYSKAGFRLRNWRSPEARRLMYLEYVLANDEHALVR